jgi:hypothetical protein
MLTYPVKLYHTVLGLKQQLEALLSHQVYYVLDAYSAEKLISRNSYDILLLLPVKTL